LSRIVPQLSEWLQLMLAEIARKQEDTQRAAEEERARAAMERAAPASRATDAAQTEAREAQAAQSS
jgi:hypothetical protein